MSRLNEILTIVTANSEEDVDDLISLLTPDSCDAGELGETFESVIGYDPISYYDKKRLESLIDDIKDNGDTPEDVSEYINSSKEELVNDAYDDFDDHRDEYLEQSLNRVIEDKTGFDLLDSDEDDADEE